MANPVVLSDDFASDTSNPKDQEEQVQEAIEEVIEMFYVGEEQVADTTECKLVIIAFGVALICFVILFLPPSYLIFSFL